MKTIGLKVSLGECHLENENIGNFKRCQSDSVDCLELALCLNDTIVSIKYAS